MKKILFYIEQEYYWTSLEPIYNEFKKDKNFELFIMIGKNQKRILKIFLFSNKKKIEAWFMKKGFNTTNQTEGYKAVFCGSQVKNPEHFGQAMLCNVDHGPGIKTLRYRHLLKQKNVKYYCFVEGKYRVEKFKKYGLDKIHEVYDTGLPKLDRFFNGFYDKGKLLEEFNLDNSKKTVLYAPSYKPTSIFMIGEQVAELSKKYNVLVKLHPYSWSGKYASHSHHQFFESLMEKYPNLILVSQEAYDIMPYMFVADTMISDGSSVINEFLAMEKCGIIVNMPDDEQKHSDGKPLLENKSSEWLEKSFIHFDLGDDLSDAVNEAISPDEKRMQCLKSDKEYIFSYTDGLSAERVKKIVENKLNKE